MNLKGSQAAKDVEVAIRGNLSLCKLNLKLYDDVVEHCEKILDLDPKNSKANYRMAQAVWELSEGVTASQVDSAFKYAKIAAEQVKNDDKVQQFYQKVKTAHDKIHSEEVKTEAKDTSKTQSTSDQNKDNK